MKKKLLSLVMLVVMGLSVVSFAGAQAAPIEIVFWHSMGGVNGEAITKMVEDFNALYEGKIKVNMEFQGTYDDAIAKIMAAGMSALPVDVVQIYDIGTRFMIDSGWAKPMQAFIDAEGYDITQIEPNIAAYYTVDGRLYSMPFNSSTPLLYYNKDAFREVGLDPDVPPKNFDEILEMARKLEVRDDANNLTRSGFGMGNYGWFFEQWVGKQGKAYVDNGNGRGEKPAAKVVFDENGAGKDILNIWHKFLVEEKVFDYLGQGNDNAKQAFISGNIAMTLESTAALKSLLVNIGDSFELGTGYFPNINAGDEGGVSIGGGSLWALASGDEAKEEAAWEFIKYMISPEVQAFWNAQSGYFPITVATHDLDAFKENILKYPQFQTAIDQLHDTSAEYVGSLLSVFPEARQLVQTYTEKLIQGEMDVDATVAGLAEKINSAIEIYNLTN
ncbi:MAG: ABC transporter substrate-binding protein [Firmicutes bacterium]|nr:ABC transporter substrate-binding protein [Bacillota bacterium]